MESARGECGEEISPSSPSHHQHFAHRILVRQQTSLRLPFLGEELNKNHTLHKKRHILCCFMKDDGTRECFLFFCTFYDK